MCFWLRQPLRDSYQILANSELKIASVAFGKCREEYHYFFAFLRFCEKKRITRAKPAYRRQDAKAQRRDRRLSAEGRLCEKKKECPPRRTGRIRGLTKKDLLHLREKEKKNFFAAWRLCEKKKSLLWSERVHSHRFLLAYCPAVLRDKPPLEQKDIIFRPGGRGGFTLI